MTNKATKITITVVYEHIVMLILNVFLYGFGAIRLTKDK